MDYLQALEAFLEHILPFSFMQKECSFFDLRCNASQNVIRSLAPEVLISSVWTAGVDRQRERDVYGEMPKVEIPHQLNCGVCQTYWGCFSTTSTGVYVYN